MPFTFSHPAIVLPLKLLPKKWFSLTGLIIGSMTPDFEYFLRMKTQSDYSHKIDGIFWFDLPLAILLSFIFHNIIRNPFFNNLPYILKSRLSDFKKFDWNSYFKVNWFVVIISILIGVSSHLFWDSFTHNHGYFVERIPTLKNTISISKFDIPVFKILQHSSTFLGAIIIVLTILKLPENKISNIYSSKYWTIFTILFVGIFTVKLSLGFNLNLYGHLIVSAISVFLLCLIITPLLIRKTAGNRR